MDTAPGPPSADHSGARILALDLGRARIGVAITDGLGLTAQPLLTIYRQAGGRKPQRADLKSIGRIVRKHSVAEIVVGNPLQLSGDAGAQSARAQDFAEALQAELGVPVHLCDERLTTRAADEILDEAGRAAHGRAGSRSKMKSAVDRVTRKRIIDQLAAVLILESFLAARANGKASE